VDMGTVRVQGDGKRTTRPRRVIVALCVVLGLGLVAGVSSVSSLALIEATNTAGFCASCHEMELFHETWISSDHGSVKKGAISASCIDCHLPSPHEGVMQYLIAKARSGTKDIVCHLLGIEPDWSENLERREEYTYESGCRKCHEELTAPEISLKAILAHKDYNAGATTESCISCHVESGHGDLSGRLRLMKKSTEEAGSAQGG